MKRSEGEKCWAPSEKQLRSATASPPSPQGICDIRNCDKNKKKS